MKCQSCKNKLIARGIKLIECVDCDNSRLVYVDAKARICNACSDRHGKCVMCGEVIKFDSK